MDASNLKETGCQLYLITPEKFDLDDFRIDLEDALSGGNVPVVQLRLKNYSEEQVEEIATELMPIAHDFGAAFIINDYLRTALKIGADGVHLGDEDDSMQNARKLLGSDFIIGSSCYDSKHRAMEAGEHDADYVAFGQFYETKTKPPKGHPTPEILEWCSTFTDLPCVAIGGIKAHNLQPLVKAGADFIAVVSAVWEHEKGPEYAVSELLEAINKAQL
jgi:thiamine-phosphate pyrophosphorylase